MPATLSIEAKQLLLDLPLVSTNTPRTCGAITRTLRINTEPQPPGRDTGTRSALTTQSDRPKVHRALGRCKQNGAFLSSDVLQPDDLFSPTADTSVADSDHASTASTVPLLATLLSLIRGLRPVLPHRRRKVRSFKSSLPMPHLPTAGTDLGKHRREWRRHSPRCTRALMRAPGRSRWLNGPCRCLHRGCTDGTRRTPTFGRTVNYSTPRGPRGQDGSASKDELGRVSLRGLDR
jgi:hypothetical protein